MPKFCTVSLSEGALQVEAAGRAPFLGMTQVKHSGPAVLKLRVRTGVGGTGKVQWRTADQETFPPDGQTVSFDLKGSADWQDATVELPVKGQLVHFRLYLPAERAPVDIASVQYLPAGSAQPVRAWDFSAAK